MKSGELGGQPAVHYDQSNDVARVDRSIVLLVNRNELQRPYIVAAITCLKWPVKEAFKVAVRH
jgi:hypothetical protein